MTESLYTTAIKNLLDLKTDMAMVVDGDSYESVIVEVDGDGNDIEKPTEEEVEAEVTRLQNILDTRKREYPTAAEWVIALVQREVDNDPTEWNELVRRRSAVKNKYNQINSPISE